MNGMYPLVVTSIAVEHHNVEWENHYTWSFFIAMLNYQRVYICIYIYIYSYVILHIIKLNINNKWNVRYKMRTSLRYLCYIMWLDMSLNRRWAVYSSLDIQLVRSVMTLGILRMMNETDLRFVTLPYSTALYDILH